MRRGQLVQQGESIGLAQAGDFHFGARTGDVYIDPLALFGQARGRVRLVDDPDPAKPLPEAEERERLLESLRGLTRGLREGAKWAKDLVAGAVGRKFEALLVLLHDAASLGVPIQIRVAMAALAWEEEQEGCTPESTPVPLAPAERRLALLVGGLGSATGRAAVLEVDTAGLGYAPDDVIQFSYRADRRPYSPSDTEADIETVAALLRNQVSELRRANPGVPIDIIGHSLGGLVARAAITTPLPPSVSTVITLGTPHLGADLASAAVLLDGTRTGHALLGLASLAEVGTIDPRARSVQQMSETSELLRDLGRRPIPASTRVLSVAARSDPIVPNVHSMLDGAANVVVTLDGSTFHDHARLPSSRQAAREIARFVGGQAPTCRGLADWLIDYVIGVETSMATDAAGLLLAAGGLWVDAKTKGVLTGPFHKGAFATAGR